MIASRMLAGHRQLALPALPIVYRRSKGDRPAPSTRRAAQQEVTQTDSLLSDAEGDLLDSYAAAMTDLPNKYRVLVLDSSYRPIEIINWKRAVCLDLFDKVDVLSYYDVFVRSAYQEHFIPAVLRVRMYIKGLSKSTVTISRRNVILRDRHTCQYCGYKGSDLTIDHVVPKHFGGLWEWDNLVAACNTCNAKKGSKSLKQLKWQLKKTPQAPSPYELGVTLGQDLTISTAPKVNIPKRGKLAFVVQCLPCPFPHSVSFQSVAESTGPIYSAVGK